MKKLLLIYRILSSQSFFIRLERNNKVTTTSKQLRVSSAQNIVDELLLALAAHNLESITQKQNEVLKEANSIINQD